MRPIRWWRLSLPLLLLLISAGSIQTASAITPSSTPLPLPPDIQWEAMPLYGQLYRTATWLPIQITITNSGVDRQFTVLADSQYALQMDVPGGGKKTASLLYYPGNQARVKLELYQGAALLASERLTVKAASGPITGNLLEQALPNFKKYPSIQLTTTSLPDNPASLAMLSMLMINGPAWQNLTQPQRSAVRDWIGQGGVLVLPGQDLAQFPEDLRPAEAGAPLTFSGTDVASVLGDQPTLNDLSGIQLFPGPAASARFLINATPLLVYQPFGQGGVFASAIVPDNPDFMRWTGFERFIAAVLPADNLAADAFSGMTGDQARESAASSFLSNFPELELPPLRLLLILLGIYIVLVGPVNHFVLRRLDRMAMAWVTIPVLTLVFAALAYGIGARQRGTDIIINDLVVIEYAGDHAQAQGYAGIFSPTQSKYAVQGSEAMLVRPLSLPWGGDTPGASARFSSHPGRVSGFQVSQWSMSMLAYQLPLTTTSQPRFQLQLHNNEITGTVTNLGPQTINDAALIIGDRAQKLGVLKPNQPVEVNLKLSSSFNQNSPSYVLYQKELDKAYRTPEGPSSELMAHTQAIDTALATNSQLSFDLAFIGFLNADIPTLELPDERYTHAQTRIVVAHPTLSYPAGDAAFDSRWSTIINVASLQPLNDVCYSTRGPGVSMTDIMQEALITFKQPAAGLAISELRFAPMLDGPIQAKDLAYEVFNWATAQWEAHDLTAGSIVLDNPQDYFQRGAIRLRYKTDQNFGMGGFWGCFSPGTTIKGTLQ